MGFPRARLVLTVIALVVLSCSAWLVESIRTPTSYAAVGWVPAAGTILAAVMLVGAGLAASWVGTPGWIGTLTVWLGMVWCAPLWVGWWGGPAWVRSVAMIVVPFGPALLLHLSMASADSRMSPERARRLVLAGYALTAAYTVIRAVVRDPFRDLYCWSNCTDNVFLVVANPGLARALDNTWLIMAVAMVGAAGALAATRIAHRERVGWAGLELVALAVLAASLAELASALLLLIDPWESPEDQRFMTLFLVRAGAYTALGAAVAWTTWSTWRTRGAVARLSVDLARAPAPGLLQEELATLVGDAELAVAYPLGDGRLVDSNGRPAADPRPGQVSTVIERGGEVVALVRHDRRKALAGDELAARVGSAARLAVDNERMRAALLARVEDLKESRARIVATADNERRRLERDLHDGAQQRLVALTYELRMARTEAEAAGDHERAAALTAALERAQAAVAELRTIAHGIHPAILTEAGLGPALWSLADAATIPVEVVEVPEQRCSEAAERAAYQAVARAIELAEARDHSPLQVHVSRQGGDLVLQIQPAEGLASEADVMDRISALGGDLHLRDGILHVEVPCA